MRQKIFIGGDIHQVSAADGTNHSGRERWHSYRRVIAIDIHNRLIVASLAVNEQRAHAIRSHVRHVAVGSHR